MKTPIVTCKPLELAEIIDTVRVEWIALASEGAVDTPISVLRCAVCERLYLDNQQPFDYECPDCRH